MDLLMLTEHNMRSVMFRMYTYVYSIVATCICTYMVMLVRVQVCVYVCACAYPIYHYQIIKRDRKSYIINVSKEYSIVSQFTSFVAIEKREKVSDNKAPCAYKLE